MSALLRTPLYDWHKAHNGRMVEFGGWEMPVQYISIVEEHHAVRKAAGLFDISHMGRLDFGGSQARQFLNHLVTSRVDTMKCGQVRYGLMCRDDGGILDDVLVYAHDTAMGLVVNAGNRLKIVEWIEQHVGAFDCQYVDQTLSSAMLAVQGPCACEVLKRLTDADLASLKYYTYCPAKIMGLEVSLSRTGYTGEDGFELILSNGAAVLAEKLLEVGQEFGIQPCGLGARDTLRLEAAMPLYGHELSESIDPLTAGLDFAVKLDKPDFIGKQALVEIAKKSDRRVRIGLQLAGRRIAREGSTVHREHQMIGEVTSGTFSPTLEQSISMAYVTPESATLGTTVEIDIRGKREAATIVSLPFYHRTKM